MIFGHWVPLAEAAAQAPSARGVIQLRTPHGILLDYPRGKSAMIHYQPAEDLRAAIAQLAVQHAGRGWLCRHTLEMSRQEHDDVDAAAARLTSTFVARFGAPPKFPQ